MKYSNYNNHTKFSYSSAKANQGFQSRIISAKFNEVWLNKKIKQI